MTLKSLLTGLLPLLIAFRPDIAAGQIDPALVAELRAAAAKNAEAMRRSHDTVTAVLREADPKTLLIPNFFMLKPPAPLARLNFTRYSPFNSAADCYGYLVIGSYYLDPQLYGGRMLEMLRNEQRFTNAKLTVPGEYSLHRHEVGGPSLFGAGEYAKDGLISITEVVGSSPWHKRMEQMMLDLMELADVPSDFGMLPSKDTELNGDLMQVLPRLYWASGDERYVSLNRRISDAYFREVLPRSNHLPISRWNFVQHRGVGSVRLRDHGNETIVGLVLSAVMEQQLRSDRAEGYLQEARRMIDQVLASVNPDGLLYNTISSETLKPDDSGLADNWGYVYGAVYNLYLLTGDAKYRAAIERVLNGVQKYVNSQWEGSHYDGFADSIESAIYLHNRMPNESVVYWMDSEMLNIWKQQGPDGHSDRTYLEGNFIRTSLLYGLMKSQGVFAKEWIPGLGIGAQTVNGKLLLSIVPPEGTANWSGEIRFDIPRHREIFHLPLNFLRLNEFPEWFTVEREKRYELKRSGEAKGTMYDGAALAAGVKMSSGDWIVSEVVSAPAR